MEWVSYLAGEPHSDRPRCVSPVVWAFCTTLNDILDEVPRQQLRPYLARMISTADDDLDEWRAWAATDWLIRAAAPRWLDAAGLPASADQLLLLPPVMDTACVETALDLLIIAGDDLRVRMSSVPRSGPVGCTSAAAERAARRAARRSVAAASWATERRPVGAHAGHQARATARAIARDAARTVVQEAPRSSGRASPTERADVALRPTLGQLDATLFDLLDRILPRDPLESLEPAGNVGPLIRDVG